MYHTNFVNLPPGTAGCEDSSSGAESQSDSELDDDEIDKILLIVQSPDRPKHKKVERNDRSKSMREPKVQEWADQLNHQLYFYEQVHWHPMLNMFFCTKNGGYRKFDVWLVVCFLSPAQSCNVVVLRHDAHCLSIL